MLPNNPAAAAALSFLNPTNGHVHAVDLPKTLGHLVCSSNGWLVLLSKSLDEAFLLNPVARSTIRLHPFPPPSPSFLSRAEQKHIVEVSPRSFYSCQAFMESFLGGCFVAFTKFNSKQRFVCCGLGDRKWTRLKLDLSCIDSFAYQKWKVYAEDHSGNVSIWGVWTRLKFTTIPSLTMPHASRMMAWHGEPVIVNYMYADGAPMKHFDVYRLDASGSGGDLNLRLVKLQGTRGFKLFMHIGQHIRVVGTWE